MSHVLTMIRMRSLLWSEPLNCVTEESQKKKKLIVVCLLAEKMITLYNKLCSRSKTWRRTEKTYWWSKRKRKKANQKIGDRIVEYNWKRSKCLQYRKGEEILIIDKKIWNRKKAPKQKYIIPWEVIKVCKSGNTYKIELINRVIHVFKKRGSTHTCDWGKKQETISKESFSEQVYIVSIDFPAGRNCQSILHALNCLGIYRFAKSLTGSFVNYLENKENDHDAWPLELVMGMPFKDDIKAASRGVL